MHLNSLFYLANSPKSKNIYLAFSANDEIDSDF